MTQEEQTTFQKWIYGSIAEYLVAHSPCSVVVAKNAEQVQKKQNPEEQANEQSQEYQMSRHLRALEQELERKLEGKAQQIENQLQKKAESLGLSLPPTSPAAEQEEHPGGDEGFTSQPEDIRQIPITTELAPYWKVVDEEVLLYED